RATKPSRNALPACSPWRCGCAFRITGSAVPKSMRCMPPRSNALARAKPGRHTSSAARCRWQPRPASLKAASLCCTPRHCTEILRRPHFGAGGRRAGSADRDRDPPHSRDKGYRGHNHAQKFRVWISGQVRRVTAPIRREMRRRAAVEPVIGHIKAEHRMGRNYLKGRDGDRINAVLAAAGYNFGLLLRWLERLLRALIRALLAAPRSLETA